MLGIKEKGILLNIISHCKRIEEKIKNLDEKQFESNLDIQEIVCFNIFQIGELAKGLESQFIKQYGKVPWSSIKGMRDRIGHGYGTIDIKKSMGDCFKRYWTIERILPNNLKKQSIKNKSSSYELDFSFTY